MRRIWVLVPQRFFRAFINSKDTVPGCAMMTPAWALRSPQSGVGGHCPGGQGMLGSPDERDTISWGVREDLPEEVM